MLNIDTKQIQPAATLLPQVSIYIFYFVCAEKWGGQKILWPPHSKKWGAMAPAALPLPTPLQAFTIL